MIVTLRKEVITDKALCRTLGVVLFVVLTSLGAFVRIPLPFTPVPLTLQTFFVLLSGAVLGASSGAFSQAGYLFLGLTGISVFSGAGSGFGYLGGPTGGYIVGFIAAAYFTGKMAPHAAGSFFRLVLIFFAADVILLSFGVLWLKCLFGYPFLKLMSIGFLPFIPGDLVKILAASLVYKKLYPRVQEIF
jgi:biotin transport system substrate-specific component